ncbi:MAG: AAA family ATPase [Lachnospiraceae bacterium]|nr:AAA family ATPase [Lachnospiraceae bacterium]
MKIRTVILDHNKDYLGRILTFFQQQYGDKLDLFSFSENSLFYEFFENNKVDVCLVDSEIIIDESKISSQCAIVYLVDTREIENYKGRPTIFKYQKASQIYKEIINIASDKISNVIFRKNDTKVEIVVFTSAKGGVGVTTTALAFSFSKARSGKKVFYLNLETLGDTSLYLNGEGNMTFSDVLFNIKSRKSNILLKMEGAVKTDSSLVDYFESSRNPYDRLEMTKKDQEILIENIIQMKDYDYIVIDTSLILDDAFSQIIMNYATSVVLVSDGTINSNCKLSKLINIFKIWEQKIEQDILGRAYLLYNRYSSTCGKQLEGLPIKLLGGIQKFEKATDKQIINEISFMEIIKDMEFGGEWQ